MGDFSALGFLIFPDVIYTSPQLYRVGIRFFLMLFRDHVIYLEIHKYGKGRVGA